MEYCSNDIIFQCYSLIHCYACICSIAPRAQIRVRVIDLTTLVVDVCGANLRTFSQSRSNVKQAVP